MAEGERLNKLTLTREEAAEILDDGGEHKFLMELGVGFPVYVVGESLEELRNKHPAENPRLHAQIAELMQKSGMVKEIENVRGGYLRVETGEMLFWGPSTAPTRAATEGEFNEAVNIRGIRIIDQWLGKKPKLKPR